MLQHPVRLGGLALVCALATSALLLVTFLATNLVLSVIGGIGLVADDRPAPEPPAAAVLLSADQAPGGKQAARCDRRTGPAAGQRSARDEGRCAEQRRSGDPRRP